MSKLSINAFGDLDIEATSEEEVEILTRYRTRLGEHLRVSTINIRTVGHISSGSPTKADASSITETIGKIALAHIE